MWFKAYAFLILQVASLSHFTSNVCNHPQIDTLFTGNDKCVL